MVYSDPHNLDSVAVEKEREIKKLINALKQDPNPRVRMQAAEALGEIRDPKSVDPLIQALRDENWEVRRNAKEALGKMGVPAVEPLIRALKDENKGVRGKAAEALGNIGDPRAVEPLIQTLKEDSDPDGYVHICTIRALGKIGDRRAVEPIIQQFNERTTLWWKSEWAEIQKWTKTKRMREKIAEPMRHALETVIRRNVQVSVAYALGEIGDAKAVEPLIQKLGDPLQDIQKAAEEALAKIGKPAVDPLIKTLKDANMLRRAGAARAIGHIRDERAVQPLIQALRDKNLGVQWNATEALGKMGVSAVEPLIQALRDENYDVRAGAAWALGEIRDRRAVEPLLRALEDEDRRVQRKAGEALKKIGGSAV
jgi:HEAT repeat protein